MGVDWLAEAIEQLEFHWRGQLRPRLDGLSDDEYFWEPVPGCWSVRPNEDGTFAPDWGMPPPDPAPFTTIAWRLAHIGAGVLHFRVNRHFGDGTLTWFNVQVPGTAAGALEWIDEGCRLWLDGIKSVDETRLAAPVGPAEGPYAHHRFATLILHINREVIHHGAEVSLLRDLYQAQHWPCAENAMAPGARINRRIRRLVRAPLRARPRGAPGARINPRIRRLVRAPRRA